MGQVIQFRRQKKPPSPPASAPPAPKKSQLPSVEDMWRAMQRLEDQNTDLMRELQEHRRLFNQALRGLKDRENRRGRPTYTNDVDGII
jgi:hypothetical protein